MVPAGLGGDAPLSIDWAFCRTVLIVLLLLLLLFPVLLLLLPLELWVLEGEAAVLVLAVGADCPAADAAGAVAPPLSALGTGL